MIDNIFSNNFNGEPIHDSFVMGIYFIVFYTFYKVIFQSLFSIFK